MATKEFTIAEVSAHNNRDDLYMIIKDNVYDLTKFAAEHPGGEEILIEYAGKDSTESFDDIGHSQDAKDLMKKYVVGTIAEAERKDNKSKKTEETKNIGKFLKVMAVAQPCVEKIYINLNAPVNFNLRQKILGDQNANLQYIVNETKANVSLRGRGSGFIEPNTGTESIEVLHIHIEHPVMKSLVEAKNLARNLLETVQQDLQVFMQTNQSSHTVPIQQPPPIIQATNNQPITIPSAILSVPPPNIIQSAGIQPTHIIQPQNFIPQSQIIPQQMQIIQQTPINIPPPTGVNIPGIRATTSAPISVQFQGQSNIQLQPANQPILVNQTPTQQYQLQYIPASNTSQAQTIQHFIQPQQHIQGIIQPNTQQFITVQGNTAFMLPPPNIVHSPQNLVFNAINQEDVTKNEANKVKTEEPKNIANSQQLQTSARTIINQPPPSIQQFLINTNAWPQNQQIHQMPIQIVTQPQQTLRSGNEILIQNTVPGVQGQQILTFAPQQGPSIQQIQFSNQPMITQPPPFPPQIQVQNIETQQQTSQPSLAAIRSNQASLSYQQQFEQKINIINDNQRRAMKRKTNETEEDANKTIPKAGMGSMTKGRPPPTIHPNQQMIKVNSTNNRMIAKTNVNTSSSSADNISINSSKNNNNIHIFTKNNSTSSITTKANTSQAETKTTSSTSSMKSENEYIEVPTSSTAVTHQSFEIQNQFMQPPPNIQFNQPRGIPPQVMMYQTQIPPPPLQHQQQDLNAFQNNNNFVQQLNVNRFNVPRGMIVQMNTVNDNAALSGNANFPQQQQQSTRFRSQW